MELTSNLCWSSLASRSLSAKWPELQVQMKTLDVWCSYMLIFLYAHPGKTQSYKPFMAQQFLGMFRLSKSSLSQMFLLTFHRRNTKYTAKNSDTVRKVYMWEKGMYIMRKFVFLLTFDANTHIVGDLQNKISYSKSYSKTLIRSINNASNQRVITENIGIFAKFEQQI